jgi:tetratricopeptide (TPR) repeat protein
MSCDLDGDFQFSYHRLLHFLSRPDERGYMFCQADDERFIQRINQSLAADAAAKGKTVRIVNLSADGRATLFRQLEQAAAGAEGLIAANFFELINDPQSGSRHLTQLNFAREALWQLGKPILFWADPGSIHAVANHAPDLYSQRRLTTVHFRGSFAAGISKRLLREGWEPFLSSEEFRRIETGIELREKRLHSALGSAYPRQRIFSEIALPLAADYARLGLGAEAGIILDEFRDCAAALDDAGDLISLAAVRYELHRNEAALDSLERAALRISGQHSGTGRPDYPAQWYDVLISRARIYVESGRAPEILPELDAAIVRLRNKAGPEWVRRQLAVMLSIKADVCYEMGQYAEARDLYQQSFEISELLSRENPRSTEARRDLSVSLDRVGHICEVQGRLTEARQYYEQSLRIVEELSTADPGNGPLQRDLCVSLVNMGNVFNDLGQPERAAEYYERSLHITRGLCSANPQAAELQRDLGALLDKMGSLSRAAGDYPGARQYFQESLMIRETLSASNPSSVQVQRELGISLDYLGDVCAESGEQETAEAFFTRSLDIAERLSRRYPDSEQLQRDLAISVRKLGVLLDAAGKTEQAAAFYGRSLEIRNLLVTGNPLSLQLQRDLSISLDDVGDVLRAMNRLGDAADHYTRSMRIREQLASHPPVPEYLQRDMSISMYNLAMILRLEGREKAASELFAKGLEVVGALALANPLSKKLKDDIVRFRLAISELS